VNLDFCFPILNQQHANKGLGVKYYHRFMDWLKCKDEHGSEFEFSLPFTVVKLDSYFPLLN
jgi:hypothetical protein